MIDIEKKLYHGLTNRFINISKPNQDNTIVKFESIIRERAILSNEKLLEKGIITDSHCRNYFENDTISVAFHRENKELYEKFKKQLHADQNQFAYDDFLDNPTFIIDSIIIKEIGVKVDEKYKFYTGIMNDELLIKNKIPLEYIQAVAFRKKNISSLSINEKIVGVDEKKYIIIRNILNKYKVNLPIIYLEDGKEITNINKKMKVMKNI